MKMNLKEYLIGMWDYWLLTGVIFTVAIYTGIKIGELIR